jgi:hypothetical protein
MGDRLIEISELEKKAFKELREAIKKVK